MTTFKPGDLVKHRMGRLGVVLTPEDKQTWLQLLKVYWIPFNDSGADTIRLTEAKWLQHVKKRRST